MPVRFEIGADLAVDHEHARGTLVHPRSDWVEIVAVIPLADSRLTAHAGVQSRARDRHERLSPRPVAQEPRQRLMGHTPFSR